MRGIVLAGGSGSRLWPSTKNVNKHILPIYDKPLIYYPIATLMLAGIRDIIIVTNETSLHNFMDLLGDGSDFGINLIYKIQKNPNGIAEALIIAERFIRNESCALILGDNIFHGVGLGNDLNRIRLQDGARIFTYEVSDPSRYGILNLNAENSIESIEEKPTEPRSNLAITGLYFFDSEVSSIANNIEPSNRGELEITSVLELYLEKKKLEVTHLSRGTCWLDAGTPESMHEASTYVRIIEQRTGFKIACLEEIGLRNGWINETELEKKFNAINNTYAKYLMKILDSRKLK